MKHFQHATLAVATVTALTLLTSCASNQPLPSAQVAQAAAQQMIAASFRAQGAAQLDRLTQDLALQACSAATPPTDAVAKQIEAEALASIQWPPDGVYLGNWREGEKIAQSGRGMTWADAPDAAVGGGCYNCHQIGPAEISHGTLGPSLLNYGKLRGVNNPADPASAAVVQYTWGKLWNSKAYNACSGMPRFGHKSVLTSAQLRDLMALLLDPASPVNSSSQ
jgi:L-cysteine S-thiosulfotransferase